MGHRLDPWSGHILMLRFGHENISMAILTLLRIQEGSLSVNGSLIVLLNCLTQGLPRNNVAKIIVQAQYDLKCVVRL